MSLGTTESYTQPTSISSLSVNLVNILYINLIFLEKIFNSTYMTLEHKFYYSL